MAPWRRISARASAWRAPTSSASLSHPTISRHASLVTAQAQVAAPDPLGGAAVGGHGHADAGLLRVAEPGDVGRDASLGELAQRGDAVAEIGERPCLVARLRRGVPHPDRHLGDHARAAPRTRAPGRARRGRGGARVTGDDDLATRCDEAQTLDEVVEPAVPGGGLPRAPRGREAAHGRVLERLGEVAERQAVGREEGFRPRSGHPRLRPWPSVQRGRPTRLVQPSQVERDDRAVVPRRALTPPTTDVPPPNGTTAQEAAAQSRRTRATSGAPGGDTTASGAASIRPLRSARRSR